MARAANAVVVVHSVIIGLFFGPESNRMYTHIFMPIEKKTNIEYNKKKIKKELEKEQFGKRQN